MLYIHTFQSYRFSWKTTIVIHVFYHFPILHITLLSWNINNCLIIHNITFLIRVPQMAPTIHCTFCTVQHHYCYLGPHNTTTNRLFVTALCC